MGDIKFSDNYNDLCQQHGVSAGFQFEFYCERCSDTWRTEFVPYRGGQASGWLGKAAGMLGGVLGNVGDAVEGLAQSGWGTARDDAFKNAVDQARKHFHRCAKCFQYSCDVCWNKDKGLCLNCAPDAEVEIDSAIAEGEIAAVREKAVEEGMKRGKQRDVTRSRQLVCPDCNTETHGAKFCPNCGKQLATSVTCPGCSYEASPGTKFCPECGKKMA